MNTYQNLLVQLAADKDWNHFYQEVIPMLKQKVVEPALACFEALVALPPEATSDEIMLAGNREAWNWRGRAHKRDAIMEEAMEAMIAIRLTIAGKWTHFHTLERVNGALLPHSEISFRRIYSPEEREAILKLFPVGFNW
jgi:hypothetical protein